MKERREKGITLVALIVTIIILIILAAVSVNIFTGNNLIELGTNAAEKFTSEQEREKDEIIKTIEEMMKDDLGALDGAISFGKLEWNQDTHQASFTVTKTIEEEYVIEYKVVQEIEREDGTIEEKIIKDYTEIESGGVISNIDLGEKVVARLKNETPLGIKYSDTASITINDVNAPEVTVTKGTVTTNSITVSVTSSDAQAGMPAEPIYKYYIKKSSDTDYPSTPAYTGGETSYTFAGREQGINYDIKVTVKDYAGNEGEGENTGIETGTLPSLENESGVQTGVIEFTDLAWANQKASIKINKTTTDSYKIVYKVQNSEGTVTVPEQEITNGGTVSNLNVGDTVIARLTDGVNYSNTASITIQDLKDPTAPSFKIGNTAVTTNSDKWYKDASITVTIVPGQDNESGVNRTTYKIEGAQNATETTGTSVIINTDGASTITATTYDNAGKSSSATLVIQRDNAGPQGLTLTAGTPAYEEIPVTASVTSSRSGIVKYEFFYRQGTTGSYTSNTRDKYNLTTPATSKDHTFTGLTNGKDYQMYVQVTDKAGNVVDTSTTPQSKTTVLRNNPPEIKTQATPTENGVTTDSITLQVMAEDPDGDNITYKLYWGTSADNLVEDTESQKTGASGNTITIPKSGLLGYTTYYWRVDVTDGKVSTAVTRYCRFSKDGVRFV